MLTARGSPFPSQRLKLYERGDTLYIIKLDESIPELVGYKTLLARDLGVHPHHITVEGFASRGGLALPMHYDLDLNFNVQLRGEKTWRVAQNDHVENPLHSYHVTQDRKPPKYARSPMP